MIEQKNLEETCRLNKSIHTLVKSVPPSPWEAGWGIEGKFLSLRYTPQYISDIFEKFRPPPWVFKCPNLNFRLFFIFFLPPALFLKNSKIFPFLNYEISPNLGFENWGWYLVRLYHLSKPKTNFAFHTIKIRPAMVEISPKI